MAEAGRNDWHISTGGGDIKALLDEGRFFRAAKLRQAFVITDEAPDGIRMLAGAAQRMVKSEIGAIDGCCFFGASLL